MDQFCTELFPPAKGTVDETSILKKGENSSRTMGCPLVTISCWRRLLRVPWTARTSNQSILKEISPEYSLEGLMLKLKLQYFGHLIRRADSFEKTLMTGKIEGRRRRGWQRMRWLDGITDSTDMGLGEFQGGGWTERPGVLWFVGSQRVGHYWVTELNWALVNKERKQELCLLCVDSRITWFLLQPHKQMSIPHSIPLKPRRHGRHLPLWPETAVLSQILQ